MNGFVRHKNVSTAAGITLLLLIGFGVWLFRPYPPSPYQTLPAREAYLIWTLRPGALTGPPFHEVLSGLGYPIPRVPGILDFLLPPTVTLTLQDERSSIGPGWTLSTNLGWRMRLFAPLTGPVQQRIEGRIYLLPNQGTLFVTPHPYFLEDLKGKRSGTPSVSGEAAGDFPSDLLMVLSASNRSREITRGVERFQEGAQFLIFPSIDSVDSLLVRFLARDRTTLRGEITLWIRDAGSSETVRGDMEYLLDLLSRTMSTGGVQLASNLRSEGKILHADLVITHADRLGKVPWDKLRETL